MASDWTSVWLASIGVGEYAQSFVDNGYDDQGICKVIGDDDLNAIGVQNARHRKLILDAVKCLGDDTRQGAAAPVYFEIEPEEQEKRSPPPVYYELEPEPAPAPKKLSRIQLKVMIRNEMKTDDVVLTEEPYSNPDGSAGEALQDLIEVYALQFDASEDDVRSCVEAMRRPSRPSSSSSSSGGGGGGGGDKSQTVVVERQQQSTTVVAKKKPPPKPTRRPSAKAGVSNESSSSSKFGSGCQTEGDYINPNEVESVPPPLDERRRKPAEKDKTKPSEPKIVSPGLPARPLPSVPQSQSDSSISPREDVDDESGRESTPESTSSQGSRSSIKQSLAKGFQGLKNKLSRRTSSSTTSSVSSISSVSEPSEATPAPSTAAALQGEMTAKDITMSDEDRLKLMTLVKEGKCSIDDALTQLQSYEKEQKGQKGVEAEESKAKEETEVKESVEKKPPPPKPVRPKMPRPQSTSALQGPRGVGKFALPSLAASAAIKEEENNEEKPQAPSRPAAVPRPAKRVPSTSTDKQQVKETEKKTAAEEVNRNDDDDDKADEGQSAAPAAAGESEEKNDEKTEEITEEKKKTKKSMFSKFKIGKKSSSVSDIAMATSEVPEEGEQKREEAGEDESGEHEVDGSGKESKRGQKIGGFFKSMLKGRGKKDKGKKDEKEEEEVSTDQLIDFDDGESKVDTVDEEKEDAAVSEQASESTTKTKKTGNFFGKLKSKFKKTKDAKDEAAVKEDEEKASLDDAEATLQSAKSKESLTSTESGPPASTAAPAPTSSYRGPSVGKARVIQEFTPSAYDENSLALKKGEIITVITNPKSGMWTGELRGKIGEFKFVYVEMLEDEPSESENLATVSPATRKRIMSSLPTAVESFFTQAGVDEKERKLFEDNGFASLVAIRRIDRSTLDDFNIEDIQKRKALLTLVKQLNYASSVPAPPAKKKTAPPVPGSSTPPSRSAFGNKSLTLPAKKAAPVPSKLATKEQDSPLDEEKPRKPAPAKPQRPSPPPKEDKDEEKVGKPVPSKPQRPSSSNAAVDSDKDDDKPKPPAKRPAPPAPYKPKEETEPKEQIDSLKPAPRPKPAAPIKPRPRVASTAAMMQRPQKPAPTGSHPPVPASRPRMATMTAPRPTKRPGTMGKSADDSKTTDDCDSKKLPVPAAKPAPAAKPVPAAKPRSPPVKPRSPSVKPRSPSVKPRSPPVKPRSTSGSSETVDGASDNKKPEVRRKPTPPVKAVKPQPVVPSQAAKAGVSSSGGKEREKEGQSSTTASSVSLEAIEKKLKTDEINLANEPYSKENGSCGIPLGLVQRYAEEMRVSAKDVSCALEDARINQLKVLGRGHIRIDSDWVAGKDWKDSVIVSSYDAWLVSLGLPNYVDRFGDAGYDDMRVIAELTVAELKEDLAIKDPRHLKRIMAGVDVLKEKT